MSQTSQPPHVQKYQTFSTKVPFSFFKPHLCNQLSENLGVTVESPLASISLLPPICISHPGLSVLPPKYFPESPLLYLCHHCHDLSLPYLSGWKKALPLSNCHHACLLQKLPLYRLDSDALGLKIQQFPFAPLFFPLKKIIKVYIPSSKSQIIQVQVVKREASVVFSPFLSNTPSFLSPKNCPSSHSTSRA